MFLAEWDEPKAGMFIWMKLNGIEDTQSLIEEKARDANGKYFYPTTGGTMKCSNKHIKKKDLKSLEMKAFDSWAFQIKMHMVLEAFHIAPRRSFFILLQPNLSQKSPFKIRSEPLPPVKTSRIH